jgi:hypothetical protein
MDDKRKNDIMLEMIGRLVDDPKHRASLAGLFAPMRLLRIRHNGNPREDVPDVMMITADEYAAQLAAFVRLGINATLDKENEKYYTPDEYAAKLRGEQ